MAKNSQQDSHPQSPLFFLVSTKNTDCGHSQNTHSRGNRIITVDDRYCLKFSRMHRRAGRLCFADFLLRPLPESMFLALTKIKACTGDENMSQQLFSNLEQMRLRSILLGSFERFSLLKHDEIYVKESNLHCISKPSQAKERVFDILVVLVLFFKIWPLMNTAD